MIGYDSDEHFVGHKRVMNDIDRQLGEARE